MFTSNLEPTFPTVHLDSDRCVSVFDASGSFKANPGLTDQVQVFLVVGVLVLCYRVIDVLDSESVK